MANKFTKSVLERQAKERRALSAAPAAQPPEPVAPPEQAVPQPDVPPEQPGVPAQAAKATAAAAAVAEPRRGARAKKPPVPDLTAYIIRDEGRNAKNKTFYLDAAVIEAIRAAAAAQKVTDSKLVNDILKKILGV